MTLENIFLKIETVTRKTPISTDRSPQKMGPKGAVKSNRVNTLKIDIITQEKTLYIFQEWRKGTYHLTSPYTNTNTKSKMAMTHHIEQRGTIGQTTKACKRFMSVHAPTIGQQGWYFKIAKTDCCRNREIERLNIVRKRLIKKKDYSRGKIEKIRQFFLTNSKTATVYQEAVNYN